MNIKVDGINFMFKYRDNKEMNEFNGLSSRNKYNCSICDLPLCFSYCSLMYLLEEANLLPNDYKHFCCACYFLDKLGLLDLEESFDDWFDEDDMIRLLFRVDYDGCEIFEIRVHDYKKYLFY